MVRQADYRSDIHWCGLFCDSPGHEFIPGQASEAWTTVQGGVIHSTVVTSHDSKGRTHYSADVQYAYRIGGKEYKSNKIEATAGTTSNSDSSGAYEVVNQYPAGRNVTVHYDPEKPWIAVLQSGIASSTYWIFGVGGLFMLMGAWIALSGIARVLLGVGMLGVLTFAWLKRDK
ncbi:MAG TPA: DUF3592 domain-containing protein [Gammaproteobacteria bacterium]|nr:DUF3592 domain-containing protein [Gammaproteobacteria bacterium]